MRLSPPEAQAAIRPAGGWMRSPVALPVGLAVLFVLLTLGLQLWPGASGLLRFSRSSYAQGAVWQLFTAQWVHLSHWHAIANAFAFMLIVLASGLWMRWPFQLLALCGGYAGVAAVLALDPDCSYYAGASGALHGLLAGNALAMAGAPGRQRPVAMAVLAGAALKLWLQAGNPQGASLVEWGFAVYYPAHVAGALGGMALVLLALLVLATQAVMAARPQPERRQ
ncbi:MAG: rhombosortase [Polaromonas sp.]|nr:rhombosortase [Polaromonas sp.]